MSLNLKLTKVHLFVILLLALVFCSFLGGACGGSTLEGLNMQSGSGSYKNMYSADKQFSKEQDALYDRKDKVAAAPNHNSKSSNPNPGAEDDSKYTPYERGQGIPASQIPSGQEDLYMLKSEMVPPVCPACPAMKCDGSNGGGGENKCPPCPPCARCPEPAFECKKVPNYTSANDNMFPRPVLNSFSQFGM